ncbi:MAG: PIN domain-containing protein [Anaerolineae bacterium]|nr:PIN domain-containing protein [Anaerolineae bacterium]
MSTHFEALVDSDAFIGLFFEQDVHFARAGAAFRHFAKVGNVLVTTNLVITETAAMLSRRISYPLACRFIEYIQAGNFPIIYVDKQLQDSTHTIFLAHQREKTSPVDCSNVAVARYYSIPSILGFDGFYKDYGLSLAG